MSGGADNLFDRVPEHIFRPLGVYEHAKRNWSLLGHLYHDFFAPEAESPEGEGWSQKHVVASIERFLLRWDDNNDPDPVEKMSSLNARAHSALSSFLESGWLSIDRIGFTQFVIMRPTVQSLFELLKNFAEQGPEFISGRVQSIRNNLLQVQADPKANAAVFQVAAKECSALLRMLNTTRMRVREASDHLRHQESTNLFLEKFFGDYISSLYIGDYSDLFSRNHPLASRWDIVDLASRITEDPDSRTHLRHWYRKNLRCRSDEEADHLLDNDVDRVLALREVDRLLTRLKDAVTRANDQALGYLEYKVRSQGNFDVQVDQVINAILRTAESRGNDQDLELSVGWPRGRLLSEDSLRMPVIKARKRKGAVIKKRELTPEAKARRLVRQIMKGNREVSEARIIQYIDRHVVPGEVLESGAMKVESVNDLCILAAFTRLGLVAERMFRNSRAGIVRPKLYRELDKHIEIELTGERFENEYLEAPAVRVRRRQIESRENAS
ncbi:Wadjet anti-phage system protein JetA family protein [Endozoicomonas sp. SESOKO1]|uniref:Wadjet anti-phage system protein JetA family protein n=1 Tax=Endozoicomonas sp. SESOKO1 TaxID=2828742 RepID=UPI00214814A5|nr:Wadjet anti-phage system protein JetA family protein [Endozoicomonas sp. SESOKO1]